MILSSKSIFFSLVAFSTISVVAFLDAHRLEPEDTSPLSQKCERRVVNGENVIVCCDKDGKNCSRT